MNENTLPKLLEDTTLEDDHLLCLPVSSSSNSTKIILSSPKEDVEGKKKDKDEKDDDDDDGPPVSNVTEFPMELQVNILTYLRAYDLAMVHQTCRFYHNPELVHKIVVFAAGGGVYPAELTQGFDQQPVTTTSASSSASPDDDKKPAAKGKKKGSAAAAIQKKKASPKVAAPPPTQQISYTFEHLRNMELLVVARVLSRPEPTNTVDENGNRTGGYYVSKSWCKTALLWLEWQQERQKQLLQQAQQQAAASGGGGHGNGKKSQKKLSKKQQRLRQRKYSDASPPWPNVNSDIVCQHQQLQRCSNGKSARARRKILDKQAWKCLKKLYPESIPLEAKEGECLQCILEAETIKKTQQQREQQLKEERKAPLSQPELRRFYTRSRGVPIHCLLEKKTTATAANDDDNDCGDDRKQRPSNTAAAAAAAAEGRCCPLIPGVYYAVPRAWCHAWRKYMKTGEGAGLLPPDGSTLLCDAHRLALLPPHLESYLYGESSQLFGVKDDALDNSEQHQQQFLSSSSSSLFGSPVAAAAAPRRSVVGLSSSSSSLFGSPVGGAPRRSVVGLSPQTAAAVLPPLLPAELGLSPDELAAQQRAMMTLERQREQQREREAAAAAAAALQQQQQDDNNNNNGARRASIGEQLDRENYCCVEILAHDELEALEKLWPRGRCFRLSFEVFPGGDVVFSTPACRECDASGMANFCKIAKNSKAQLRAAHQARVRIYKEQKSNPGGGGNFSGSSSNSGGGGSSKPGVQLEY